MASLVLVAHQPAYLPWPGYFSRLLDVPELILLDHVSYSQGGWQNRNFVQDTRGQRLRLTVPVSARTGQPIGEVRIADQQFRRRHWRTLRESYSKAPHWSQWEPQLQAIYARCWHGLADLNEELTRLLLRGLGINVTVLRSSALRPAGAKTAMLADLAARSGIRVLRVGEGALTYLDTPLLAARGIAVEVAGYQYPAGLEPRSGLVSALDLLLRHGPQARQLLAQGAVTRTLDPATAWRGRP